MSRFDPAGEAGRSLRMVDGLAALDSPMHRLSPLPKLLMTVLYIALTLSFPKYALSGLSAMVLFPIFGYQLAGISPIVCLRRLRFILPLVCAVGVFNPFFDRDPLFYLMALPISGGVISMLTLLLKGVFTLFAAFLLIATTPLENICGALRGLRCPRMLVSLLLLTFRYITVLLDETSAMTEAYSLRAPGQRGVHISAWGSFLGQLLLRSMDRAESLYNSMLLRGFHGEFPGSKGLDAAPLSWTAAGLCAALMAFFRIYDVPAMLGALITGG